MVVNYLYLKWKKKGSGDEGGEAHYLETFMRFAPFCSTRGLGKEKKGQASLCAWLLIYKDFIAFIIIKLFVLSQNQTLSVSAQDKFAASRKG